MQTRILAPILIAISLVAQSCSWLTAHSGYAKVDGIEMYYETHGAGTPLLMLHGGGGTVEQFRKQVPFFARHYLVVTPEQVGHGHTKDRPGPLSYSQMTKDTAALMKTLGLHRADVVGWSDGGIIALMLAVHYPSLVRSVVASGANFSPGGVKAEANAGLNVVAPAPGVELPFQQKLANLWLLSPTPNELSIDLLHRIRAPVLIISGDNDEIRLDHTIEMVRAIPNAELCILPGTGHNTFGERPRLMNSIIWDFLRKNE